MRSFRDSANVHWTVFEVRRQITSRGDAAVLPSGFNAGWLCFEAVGAKRRLARYPDRWRELTDTELVQLLAEAQPAPRSAFRVTDDLTDPPVREL